MRLFLIWVFMLLTFVGADAATKYTVREGDTLWSIAEKFYGNAAFWQFIWEKNSDQVKNPHWIYPGQSLLVPSVEEIRSTVKKKGGFIEEKKRANPLFTLDAQLFVPYIADEPPRIYGVVSDEAFDPEKTIYSPGDFLNLTLKDGTLKHGEVLLVYAVLDKDYKDPITGERLGYYIKNVGLIKVVEVKANVALARVLKASESILAGYYATRFVLPDPIYRYRPFKGDLSAKVVALESGRSVATLGDVVVVDAGRDQGLSEGSLVRAVISSWNARVADLVVVKATRRTSSCVVYKQYRSLELGTRVVGVRDAGF